MDPSASVPVSNASRHLQRSGRGRPKLLSLLLVGGDIYCYRSLTQHLQKQQDILKTHTTMLEEQNKELTRLLSHEKPHNA